MKSAETWKYIHSERVDMAETLSSLTPARWSTPSWCAGWSVQETAGHIVAAAEQTPMNFYRQLASAGFKFNVFTDRDAKRLGALGPDELVRRLQARTTTTNHPPAPVMAMLGEIVAHGEDIRRPLGLVHQTPEAALVAVANNWCKTNLLLGAKRRIAGLRLRSTDIDWSRGDGPEVAGPLQSLLLAMVGRKGALPALSGDGVSMLVSRS
jgi:uncharacterized protein (TIGR03083 family)